MISTANRCGLVEAFANDLLLNLVRLISTANRCGLVEAGGTRLRRIRAC